MSRADKTQAAIVYDLYLDEQNERLERLDVTVLCAMRDAGDGCGPQDALDALTSAEHVAFVTSYRFSDRDGVEPFEVPREVVRLLR